MKAFKCKKISLIRAQIYGGTRLKVDCFIYDLLLYY